MTHIPQAPSAIAELFALQIRAEKLPRPLREFRFHPTRKWRLDFAWPDMRLAVEVDGEVHRIKARFHADLEKHAELALTGWTLLRVGGREVRSGVGLTWLQRLLWERAPLGLSRAHESSDPRRPALDANVNENHSHLPTSSGLWITGPIDRQEALEPSKVGHKWAITP